MFVHTFALCHSISLYDRFSPTSCILRLNSAASIFTAEPSPWTLLFNLVIPSASLSSYSQTGVHLMTTE